MYSFAWVSACAVVSGWQPMVRRLHKRAAPLRATFRDTFHAEGDQSGAFQLSGVWKLERQPDDAVEAVPIQTANPSWSGDRWSDVVREMARKQRQQELVALDAAGGWSTPPGASVELRGKWSMDNDAEVTLARYGRHGNSVLETWTGQYDASTNQVEGTMLEGASEPEYAGRFSLTPAFPSLQPVVENTVLRKNETRWGVPDVTGDYTLEFQGDGSLSAFDVQLAADRSWTSVGLAAAHARGRSTGSAPTPSTLAGTWNVFESDVNTASGIDGVGPRVWLWLRRSSSHGVHLEQDRLYLGRIAGAAGNATSVRHIKGHVAVGWAGEPAFIGSFRLVPRH